MSRKKRDAAQAVQPRFSKEVLEQLITKPITPGELEDIMRHLKGNNSRDRRYGFRLYFFWDDENEVVVVGSLPEHLDNRAT